MLINNSCAAIGDFCHLLITFSSSLDPDQAQQNFRPDLDPNFWTLIVCKNYPACKELKLNYI